MTFIKRCTIFFYIQIHGNAGKCKCKFRWWCEQWEKDKLLLQCGPEVAAFMPHPECESNGNDFWFYLLCDKKYVNANKREYKMVIKSMTRCFTKFQQGACPLCWQHWQQQQIKSITMPLKKRSYHFAFISVFFSLLLLFTFYWIFFTFMSAMQSKNIK